MKTGFKLRRLPAILLCLCMVLTSVIGCWEAREVYAAGSGNGTTPILRTADASTMDTFKGALIDEEAFTGNNDPNGSRYAGRIWVDKSVFANGEPNESGFDGKTLTLDEETDGISSGGNTTITLDDDEDFLHAFSALGSTQEFSARIPVNLVIVIDNSGSMYTSSKTKQWVDTRMAKIVEAVNRALDSFMIANVRNQAAVVLFGDGEDSTIKGEEKQGTNTARTIIPMGHYEPDPDIRAEYESGGAVEHCTPYLQAGWGESKLIEKGKGVDIKRDASFEGESGYVFVDWQELSRKPGVTGTPELADERKGYRYDAYKNGTTNINAGFYRGMQELLNAPVKEELGNTVVTRIPALVVMTDGAATDALLGDWYDPVMKSDGLVNDFGNKNDSFTGLNPGSGACTWDQFVKVLVEEEDRKEYEIIGGSNNNFIWIGEGESRKKQAVPPDPSEPTGEALQYLEKEYENTQAYMMLNTIMNASYMTEAVKKTYDNSTFDIYTVTVDMPNPETANVNGVSGRMMPEIPNFDDLGTNNDTRITSNAPTMNPGKYFNKDWLKTAGYYNNEGEIVYEENTVGYSLIKGIETARDAWDTWKNGREYTFSTPIIRIAGGTNLEQYESSMVGHVEDYHNNYWRVYVPSPEAPVMKDIPKNDKYGITKADLSLDYVKKSYYADSSGTAADSIGEVFNSIMDEVNQPLYTSVEGSNDLGVTDALTYVDPIGEYMEVKDVKNLVLFGENYPVIKTAVYDYNFIKSVEKEKGTFITGWYKNSDKSFVEGNIELDKWADCTYYVDKKTAEAFAPNVSSETDEEKLKNTVYTLYRLKMSIDEYEKWRWNKSYGEEPAPGWEKKNNAADQAGAYRLCDIRIWVESSNGYVDPKVAESDILTNTSYDDALYVNVPAKAIPQQVASIELDLYNNIISYKTNLYKEGTEPKTYSPDALPLRVFYSVGLKDEIRSGDGVDIAKISWEYMNTHREDGKVYFNSNWYSGQKYLYETEQGDGATRGDPAVSFSPNAKNNYYIFQKNFPLYSVAESDSRDENGIPEGKVLTEAGKEEFEKGHFSITAVNTGDNPKPTEFNSNQYYYILADYYVSKTEKEKDIGEHVYRAVALKGSELGSMLGSDKKGALVVWYDKDTGQIKDYVPAGEPGGGKAPEGPEEWILATKQGGLRTGDLFQNKKSKGENKTKTAYDYFTPTISSSTGGTADDTVVNVYLGNNGRLEISDSRFLVTKAVDVSSLPEEKQEAAAAEKFKYQVYIQGISEKFSGDSYYEAVVVEYDEDSNEWTRALQSIDLKCDNQNLLLGKNGSLAVVDGEGNLIADPGDTADAGQYYVYLEASDTGSVRIYQYNDKDLQPKPDAENRYVDHYIKDVKLIPRTTVDSSGRWTSEDELLLEGMEVCTVSRKDEENATSRLTIKSDFSTSSVYRTEELYFGKKAEEKTEDFTDGPLKAGQSLSHDGKKILTDLTEEDLYDPAEKIEYMASGAYTDLKGVTEKEIVADTAEFTLGNKEGLLFMGLPETTYYRTTEMLPSEPKEGQEETEIFRLKQVGHRQGYDELITYYEGTEDDPVEKEEYGDNRRGVGIIEEAYTNGGKNYSWKDHTKVGTTNPDRTDNFNLNEKLGVKYYSITGNVGKSEESVHYTNFIVYNPKEEITPGEGELVGIGETQEFEIQWNNYDEDTDVNNLKNDKDAAVVIKDKLDEGVDFVKAGVGKYVLEESMKEKIGDKSYAPYGEGSSIDGEIDDKGELQRMTLTVKLEKKEPSGTALTAGTPEPFSAGETSRTVAEEEKLQGGAEDGKDLIITYDNREVDGKKLHTVTWNFTALGGEKGHVDLSVRVNEKAREYWDYSEKNNTDHQGENDYRVKNKASVKVGNFPEVDTDIIENPVEPDKEETEIKRGEENVDVHVSLREESIPSAPVPTAAPGEPRDNPLIYDAPLVYVGDEITYKIDWVNYHVDENKQPAKANVVIKDILDEGVDFVSASYKVKEEETVTLKEEDLTGGTGTREVEKTVTSGPISIKYEETAGVRTITWDLGEREPREVGSVELVVRVNDKATPAGKVDNRALVKAGKDPGIYTSTVENPTPNPKKTEETPGDGKQVAIGDEIEYAISWENRRWEVKSEPSEGTEYVEAKVTIIDKLDPGVDFVQAGLSDPEGKLILSTDKTDQFTSESNPGNTVYIHKVSDGETDIFADNTNVIITNNIEDGTVKWEFTAKPSTVDKITGGIANLTVKVNKNAVKYWDGFNGDYEEWTSNYKPEGTQPDDYEVYNQASVQLGDDSAVYTEIVENPIPGKTETEINGSKVKDEELSVDQDGTVYAPLVQAGDTITYDIHWENMQVDEEGNPVEAVVVIEDELDEGVDFVKAGFDANKKPGGVILEADPDKPKENKVELDTFIHDSSGKDTSEKESITYTYDETTGKGKVVWKFMADPAGQGYSEGTVTLTVQVNEHVKNGVVDNKASVSLNTDKRYTNVVENPVPSPKKTETKINEDSAGEGEEQADGHLAFGKVKRGDNITYQIDFNNNYNRDKDGNIAAADVTIEDPLDDGVDFVRAKYKDVELTEGGPGVTSEGDTITISQSGITITYNKKDHTVIWTFSAEPGEKDYVELEVQVNEKAVKYWNGYEDPSEKPDPDFKVLNRAKVDFDNKYNKYTVYTDIVENPLDPDKVETSVKRNGETKNVEDEFQPGEDDKTFTGPTVYVGDEITYEIYWVNKYNKPASVTIEDPLDPGVTFMSASEPYKYNRTDHKVVWELGVQNAGASGTVTLTVKVNDAATPQGKVHNRATVTVGNESFYTSDIENPTPKSSKRETAIGERKLTDGDISSTETVGGGKKITEPEVEVGDVISYEIDWENYSYSAKGEALEAKITIEDKLDEGVDFVSAGFKELELKAKEDGGDVSVTGDIPAGDEDLAEDSKVPFTISYNATERTVTWTFKAKPDRKGTVSLQTKVNRKAQEYWNKYYNETNTGNDFRILNQASVQIDNGWKVKTDIIENPTPNVEKSETKIEVGEGTPGEEPKPKKLTRDDFVIDADGNYTGPMTYVGEKLTYTISWVNRETDKDGKPAAAAVVITDPLDPGVDFVSAGVDGSATVLEKRAEQVSGTLKGIGFTISYDGPAAGDTTNNGTVTWNLGEQPAGASGVVTLTVQITEAAVKEELPEGEHHTVENTGYVLFGNDSKVKTETVTNPVPDPEKTEETPGKDSPVGVGDIIDYEISWENYSVEKGEFVPAKIIIEDPLDDGVTFVSADFVDEAVDVAIEAGIQKNNVSKEADVPELDAGNLAEGKASITYTKDVHTVVWTFTAKPNSSGKVKLRVKVNENAVRYWDEYSQNVPQKDFDYKVLNRASVEVENEPKKYTEIIPNPVEPEKRETEPNDGDVVKVGQELHYEILWVNDAQNEENKAIPANVTVSDLLDKGVDFVEAEFNGTKLIMGSAANKEEGNVTSIEGEGVQISYDKEKHLVTWKLFDRPAGASGWVNLIVKVNENANRVWDYAEESSEGSGAAPGQGSDPASYQDDENYDHRIVNKAKIEVDNGGKYTTNVTTNYTEPEKTEVDPGENKPVTTGQEVTYQVTWKNTHSEKAKITITDLLDDGVTIDTALLAKASAWRYVNYDPQTKAYTKQRIDVSVQYDRSKHKLTWVLPEEEPEALGYVEFTVRVNEKAREYWNEYGNYKEEETGADDDLIRNQAKVQVGNDPEVKTEIIENPVSQVEKVYEDITDREGREIEDPSEDTVVNVKDRITYGILWENTEKSAADVTITDTLDPGFTFISATPEGQYTYDTEGHTVKWTLKDQPAGASGKVTLTVEVNEKAQVKVENTAQVKVGNQPEMSTNTLENPTDPYKEEITPGEGQAVKVGDPIRYAISWHNANEEEADVEITDVLDPGVDFVGASCDGLELSAAQDGSTVETEPSADGSSIRYNSVTRTVTWTLPGRGSNERGTVLLDVKVNDQAEKAWDYGTGAGSGDDNRVVNQARVKVGNVSTDTNKVENPVPGQEKTEDTPGEGKLVVQGQQIDYSINWKNYHEEAADVTITDKLDPGVDFVSAEFGEGDGRAELTAEDPDLSAASPDGKVTISYSRADHTVTWILKERPEKKVGAVKLSVKVNDQAAYEWNYKMYEDTMKGDTDTETKDLMVYNKAKVQVGNDAAVDTNIVENPVDEAEKKEITPGDGESVKVGDQIEYSIEWTNDLTDDPSTPDIDEGKEPVNLEIIDPLDKGVDFVSASYGDLTLSAAQDGSTVETEPRDDGVSIRYDETTRTVTWKLGELAHGSKVTVGLIVEVNEEAQKASEVENQGRVVANGFSVDTNVVKNPTGGPEKTETDPGEGELVEVGKEITYEINWRNDKETEAEVTITDKLDPGVDFVSADNRGSYDPETHTVTWNLGKQPVGEKGTVTLKVKVNDKAVYEWNYEKYQGTTEPNTESKDLEVYNKASVKVGNSAAVDTNVVENPVEPQKTETNPGDGELVGVGEEITYQIDWKNYEDQKAKVEITDKLDPGVDFVSAEFGEDEGKVELTASEDYEKNPTIEASSADEKVKISYNKDNHIITWNLGEQEAGTSGTVTLTVKVNNKAALDWKYGETFEKTEKDPDPDAEHNDYEVWNKAKVTVGNDSTYTNEVENPVPDKAETEPGEGQRVKPGDEITYEIYWKNTADETDPEEGKANVVITDPLDPNVELVSASFKDAVLTFNPDGPSTFVQGSDPDVTIDLAYDYKTARNVVTWTLGNRAAGAEGTVTLTVKVKDSAVEEGKVKNQADVKVGNTSKQTRELENPTGGPEKREVTPGEGNLVGIGDTITYEIDWRNDKETEAEVIVTDKLDPGVDFVSADHSGTHDPETHTVTWSLGKQAAGASGTVSLTVEVNDKAALSWNYKADYDSSDNKLGSGQDYEVRNKAKVEVDHDPSYTNEVENPVPDKEETEPGEGQKVKPGDEITYEIHWKNAPDETNPEEGKADVTITDPLDHNVELVSASVDGVTLEAPEEEIASPTEGIAISYKDHTVTWTLKEREAGEEGTVTLTVRVKDSAVEEGAVENQATVQVGHTSAQTRKLYNPTEPQKEETTPGDGELVGVGTEITYEIDWKNYKDQKAKVEITDRLDPGVDFVSADNSGSYDPGTHTVTWDLGEKEAGDSGTVTLTVKVNNKAALGWKYGDTYEETPDPDVKNNDYEVWNKAKVTVDNVSTYTNEVENPVPDKEETTPGEGTFVKPGDEISYKIHWENAHKKTSETDGKATVTITDELDPNVEFVSAAFGEVMLTADNAEGSIKGSDKAGAITIRCSRNAEGAYVVTWILELREPGSFGDVELSVKVKDSALDVPKVDNQAKVQVDHKPAVDTRIVENPTSGPEKTETTPGDGKLVNVGDPITYEITWKNYKDTIADVTITDRLDPGVDFVSADQSGSYDAGTHTVTWTLKDQAAGATGTVTLQVKTNEKAVRTWSYEDLELKGTTDYKVLNKASVKVGNDDAVDTNVVENPLPKKDEITPGEDEFVGLGREIVYTIQWANNTPDDPATTDIEGPAHVTIEDTLDPGVDFVSAASPSHGVTLSAAGTTVEGNGITITYDPAGRKVTWDLGVQASGESGEVSLTVKVNRNAFVRNEVTNGADVTVGDNTYKTNLVSNPTTNPQKVETAPGADEMVLPGENIVYHITWKNYKTEAANVVIRDTLDPNVEYVGSDFGGVYDEASRTVTWTLENQAAGAEGIVELEVEVLESAVEAGRVENEARVKVGNDDEVWTEKIENPTPNPKKKEIIPGAGEQVHVGEEITYEITWRNYRAEPAAVRIRDILDPGVDFVEASDGGVCTEGIVNWNLGVKQPGEEGEVTLTVRVNEKAVQKWSYKVPALDPTEEDYEVWNQASVKVGNDEAVKTEIVENPLAEPAAAELQLPPVRKDVVSDTGVTETYTMKGGEFEFLFTPAAGNPEADPVKEPKTLTNSPDGSISLGSVTYTKAGVYKYTLVEVSGTVPGILYDSTVYEITVRVTANADGTKLEAAVEVSGNSELPADPFTDSITFENTYNPDKTGIALQGDKVLTGGKLTGGDFTFVLEPASADVEEEAQSTVQTGNEGEPNGSQSEISGTGEPGGNEQAPGNGSEGEPSGNGNQSEISGTGEPSGNEQAPGNGSEGEISGTGEPGGNEQAPGNGNQSEISGTGEPSGNGSQSEISGTGEPNGNELAPGNGSEGEISGTGEPSGNEQAPGNEANGGEAEVIGFSSGMGEPMDIFTQQPEGEALFGSSASPAANAASGTVLNCPVQARIHQHTAECFDAEGNNLCGKEDFVLHVHDINCYNEYGELDCTLPEIEPHVHDINCYDHYDVPVCGLEETGGHVHTDSCYAQTLICGIPEGHVHDDFCYATENVLSCGQEEYGHIHDPYSCYNEFGELICGQEEWGHVHTGSCYTPVTYLVCGIPEGHSHTDSCYQTVLACGQEEGTGHVHTLECYGCTLEYLTCTKPELKLEAHTHTQECYAVRELSAEHPEHTEECYDENGLLVCGGRICGKTELLAHQHDAGCFTAPAAQVMAISDGTGEADGITGNDGTDPNGQNTADGITGNDGTDPNGQNTADGITGDEGDDPNGQGTEETGSGLTSEQDTEGNGSGTAAIKALGRLEMPMPGGLTAESVETHNTAAGIFQFGTITFDKAGTYVYKITEKQDGTSGNGIVYDGTVYRVTVKVTRTGEGLTAAIEKVETVTIADGREVLEAAGAVVFRNTYIPPELVIEKEHDRNGGERNRELQEVVQGDIVTYYLTIKNVGAPGSTTAKNVTVTDTIPQGLILVEGSVSDGGTVNGREITWNLNDMEAAAEKTVSFQVRIPKVYEDTTWTNIGYLTYDDPHDPGEPADPEHPDRVRKPSNEVQEHEGVPHVVIRKLQSVNGGRKTTARLTVHGGDTVTYYLVITNDGTYPAEDVVVKDVIPEGLTLVAGSVSDGGAVNGREITWSLGELPQGRDREVSFRVTVPEVEEYTMWTNMGRLTYGNNPENPEDGPDTEIPSNEVQIEEEPPRPTPTPDVTPRPTPTDRPDPTPTDRPSPSPSVTPGPSPSVSPSPSPSISPSPSPSVSPSPSPSVSPSPSPSVSPSPSPSPSVSPSPSPSVSPSPSPSVSPSPSPSISPSPSPSVSPSPSPSVTPAPTGPASLEVQKDLIYVVNDEESVPLYARSQTFYVALFEDPECTVRVSDVQALTYSGTASASVVFENLEPGKTYYVGEVDASGNVLEGNSGVLRGEIVGQGLEAGDDDVVFDVNFSGGNGATVTEEDGVTRVEFENDFYEIPDGFFLNGILNITKIVLDPDGNPAGSDETFYAGIFADPEYTQLSPDVEYNIVPLSMDGSSELTVSVRVREYESGDAITLYVTEVDANGVPVDGSFGYQVTVENGELTFDDISVVQDTVITNRTTGVSPSPTPVPERVTSTPTPAPVRHPGSSGGTRVVPTPIPNQGYLKDSPKTGDDTNIAMWVVLLALAAAAAGAAVFVRKRSK